MEKRIEDYLGKEFGYFTVVGNLDGSKRWIFRCICGTEICDIPSRILGGHKQSCGCMRYSTPKQKEKRPSSKKLSPVKDENYIGRKMNKLTVVRVDRPEDGGRVRLECLCDCGKTAFVYPYQFDKGKVKSCGCARTGNNGASIGNSYRRTHGMSKNRFYKRWNDMIRRCYDPREPAFRFYGAQGTTVCEQWRHSPEQFIAWCEENCPVSDENLTLDRIDGSKGYSPENCRFISQPEQTLNLKSNRWVTMFGETKCVAHWCKEFKVSPGIIYRRVHTGLSFEEAFQSVLDKRKTAAK